MTKAEFKERIKGLAFEVIRDRKRAEIASVEYDELTKFPELKEIIISLLTTDFDPFLYNPQSTIQPTRSLLVTDQTANDPLKRLRVNRLGDMLINPGIKISVNIITQYIGS